MRSAFWILACGLGWGCSAAEADAPGGASGSSAGGTAGLATGGTSASAGSSGTNGGSGGAATTGGASSGGSAQAAGAGGALAGNTSGGSSAGGAVAGTGGASGGSAGGGGCVPDPNGGLSVKGEVVHDSKSCLDWMKATKTGVNYAAAEMYCGDATTGGFDDWRIPNASEFASIVTLCGKYAPDGPVDTKVFELAGDGYWTTTPAGEPNKVCAVGMLNAGGYYHYGTAGPQVVRCVRGAGTFKMVKDCMAAQGCSNW